MAVYLLDGRRCPALFLSGANPDGSPQRAVYWFFSSEGSTGVKQDQTASLVAVPDDDGASWTVNNYPSGANFYVIVPDDSNLNDIDNRLVNAYNRREALAKEAMGGATHGEPAPGVGDMFKTPATELTTDQRPLWQQQGFPSKQAWKDATKS